MSPRIPRECTFHRHGEQTAQNGNPVGNPHICFFDSLQSIRPYERFINGHAQFLCVLLRPDSPFAVSNANSAQPGLGGWAENFDLEWDMLVNCISLAREEERMMKVKVADLEEELGMLRLEASWRTRSSKPCCTRGRTVDCSVQRAPNGPALACYDLLTFST